MMRTLDMLRGFFAQLTTRSILVGSLLSADVLADKSPAAPAPESDAGTDAKRRAAALFDRGVREFSEARYETAARTFLAADELAPSPRALVNAIAAARQAGQHLLVAKAAQRALEHRDIEPQAATLARDALAEAARSLTRIDVDCAPVPCVIFLDGQRVSAGVEYTLPGSHDLVAQNQDGARAVEHVASLAGASYRVSLRIAPAGAAAQPSVAPEPKPRRAVAPQTATEAHETRKPLPPAVFVAGGAVTVTLTALTVWSGLQALSAKRLHETDPAAYDPDHVRSLARRTDYFLAGAVIAGAATAVAGIWLVDWGSGTRTSVSTSVGGGVVLAVERQF